MAVILAIGLILLGAAGCAVTISEHRSGPERRIVARERRARWEDSRV